MFSTCAIGLGANLGDPQAMLERAINLLRLNQEISIEHISSTWFTEPVGGPANQNWYYNRAVTITTQLEPIPMLRTLLKIEAALGRVRVERHGPRYIDLDLLFMDQDVVRAEELTLPHPRLHERAFVLYPLGEVAPDWIHPLTRLSIPEMIDKLPKNGPEVRKIR
ncbi:MAG: 2-amino-4-hydroxy-6-hydroxymethyldihydropteridine diphosphokinase [Deltaproteobacteria bacterium]|nr:2-amino-4-hydroxy-6-hydroxymethyldihydropteridine diphosphokinase [Deltaproteobacteria bacterium]